MEATIYPVNGINLNVWEQGPANGPVILFLHGFPEAGFAWNKQASFFAAKGYRVLAPDQRGYNLSSKPKQVKDYQMDLLVADIADLINTVAQQKVVLVGHDWGGGVAWHLAMRHPELVERLVILNMPHPQVMHDYLKNNNRQRRKSSYAAFFQVPVLPEWVSGAFRFRMLERTLHRTALPGTFSNAQIAAYKKAWKQPGALTGMINWYRAYRFFNPKPFNTVEVPTLIIWGQKDPLLMAEMAQHSMLPCRQAQLSLLAHATHWLHHEDPDRVNNLIWDFIR